MQEIWVWYLDWEVPLEKGMVNHSGILSWEILWTEEPVGLPSHVAESDKLLLLLSLFSHVWFLATPWTVAHQAPLSLGFSRQEHWSGLPFPSPMHESESEIDVAQSCPTLSDPMDCRLPGSSVHGIFQARVLEWVAIAFSGVRQYGATNTFAFLWVLKHKDSDN